MSLSTVPLTTTLANSLESTLPTAILPSSSSSRSLTVSISLQTDSSVTKSASISTGSDTSFYSNLRIMTDSSSLANGISSVANNADGSGGLDENSAQTSSAINTVTTNGALSHISTEYLNWKLGVIVPSVLIIPCLL